MSSRDYPGQRIVPRAVTPLMESALRAMRVVVVTGPRQAGKSTQSGAGDGNLIEQAKQAAHGLGLFVRSLVGLDRLGGTKLAGVRTSAGDSALDWRVR